MAALSFLAMVILMYAMVDAPGNVLANINQLYMAGLMTAPMVVLELALMRSMYPDKRANTAIAAASVAGGVLCFALIRTQAFVSDGQFLRSMIPHHGGALLMCREAPLRDPDVQALCSRILASQQAEIEEMSAKLRELEP